MSILRQHCRAVPSRFASRHPSYSEMPPEPSHISGPMLRIRGPSPVPLPSGGLFSMLPTNYWT